MKQFNNTPDYFQWIVVKKSINMDVANKAHPLCFVNTPDRDVQASLSYHLGKTGMMAYNSDYYKDIFAKKYNLSELEVLSVDEFISKYPSGIKAEEDK